MTYEIDFYLLGIGRMHLYNQIEHESNLIKLLHFFSIMPPSIWKPDLYIFKESETVL